MRYIVENPIALMVQVCLYHVNTKVASAMIHSGISQTAARRFASAMGLPTLSFVTLKRCEREIGP